MFEFLTIKPEKKHLEGSDSLRLHGVLRGGFAEWWCQKDGTHGPTVLLSQSCESACFTCRSPPGSAYQNQVFKTKLLSLILQEIWLRILGCRIGLKCVFWFLMGSTNKSEKRLSFTLQTTFNWKIVLKYSVLLLGISELSLEQQCLWFDFSTSSPFGTP